MSYASVVKAQRAQRNRVYVRELLRQRQPAFAAALESAEQYLSCALAQTGNDVGLMMAHETCHLCRRKLNTDQGAATECEVLVQLLKAVRAHESRVQVMRGDPELDKTALLGTHLEQGADRGQRDLRSHDDDRGELVDQPVGRRGAAGQPDHLSQWLAEEGCVRAPGPARRMPPGIAPLVPSAYAHN